MTRLRLFAAGLITLLAVVIVVLLARGAPAPYEPARVVEAGALMVTAPTSVAVGSAFEVIVEGLDAKPVAVSVDDGYALRTFIQAPGGDGTATVEIPAVDGPSSGVVRVSVLSGTRSGTASVSLEPSAAVDPHDLYLGPRTVAADGVDHTMIVAVPRDRLGNPVASGTEVAYKVTRADLSVEEARDETEHLVSYARVTSNTVAGKTRVAVNADDATAREMTFLEVANIPEPFALTVIDPLVPADGVTVLLVRTDVLADQFGNVLPDGVDASLDLDGVTGTRRVKGETIKGVAEFAVEAPDRPGDVTMRASTSGRLSEPLTITFAAAVTDAPFTTRPDADGLRVAVGPVLTTRGAYVAEGTTATIFAGDETFAAPISNGIVEIVIPATTEAFELDVLGHRSTWVASS